MNHEIYLAYLKDILSTRLFLFGVISTVLLLALLIFLIARPLRNKTGYVALLLLGALVIGGVETIPVYKDVKNSSIITLANAEYQMVESGGLRSKNYTMVATIPNGETVYSIRCGAMQDMPQEGRNITIVFAEHSKILLEIIP